MGDLNARRGKIVGMEPKSGAQHIQGQVPLATMFGYATDLRSRTQGRATYTMQFSHYAAVPKPVSDGDRGPHPRALTARRAARAVKRS